MSDPTRGITCSDMRRIVREALAGGWEWAGIDGRTHARIVWKDGTELRFGCTPSLASWKSTATDIERVSGITVWRRGNKKRSRKAIATSGFNQTYRSESAAAVSDEAARLREEWEQIENYLLACVSTGSRPNDALQKALRRQAIAERLRDMYQPIPPSAFPVDAS